MSDRKKPYEKPESANLDDADLDRVNGGIYYCGGGHSVSRDCGGGGSALVTCGGGGAASHSCGGGGAASRSCGGGSQER